MAIFFLPGLLDGDGDGNAGQADTTATSAADVPLQPPPDSSAADTMQTDPLGGPSVIWVSNRAPEAGVEIDYRTGVLSSYSHVYPFAGGRPRQGSLLMVRRNDTSAPMREQTAWRDAAAIMGIDTTLEAAPVDVTILVGADLRYDGVNEGILRAPSNPSGTLYVDVVNQGIEYPPDGTTPAHVWLARLLDGRSIVLQDRGEWLLMVVDTRWGDRERNEEVPLAYGMEGTAFLYRRGSALCRALEASVREAVQPLPRAVAGPPDGLVVPDIWILVGGPADEDGT
jgi:hypothetical protein